jgi:hypothetical protein
MFLDTSIPPKKRFNKHLRLMKNRKSIFFKKIQQTSNFIIRFIFHKCLGWRARLSHTI